MDFWLMLLSWMFILSYTTIYFFVKNFTFSNVYISVNTMFQCFYMFFGWERSHELSTYATLWGVGIIQNVRSCVSLAFSVYSLNRNNTDLFHKSQFIQANSKTTTDESKLKHYSRLSNKLLDSKSSPKP